MDMEEDILVSIYFKNIRIFLSIFGLWPYQNKGQAYALRLNTMLIGSTIIIPTICKIVEKIYEHEDVLWAVPSQLFYVETYVKIFFMMLSQKKMKGLLDSIKRNFQSNTGKNLETLHRYAANATTINFYYGVYGITTAVAYSVSVWIPQTLDFILPLNESRPRPIPRLMRYYSKRIDDNYNFIVLHGMLVDTLLMFMLITFDMLLTSCGRHACALFKIVVNDLEDCLNINGGDMRSESGEIENISKLHREQSEQIYYSKIVRVIVAHRHALEFSRMLNSVYSMIAFFTIGLSFVSITLVEFETVIHIKDSALVLRFMFYTIAEIIHILYYNLPGQNIEEYSLRVYQSCYNCEWYRADVPRKCRHLLKLMIARGQIPMNLTAGKVIILSFDSFARTIKASVSFFTVLLSMH